jgi:O-antigen/teichoic acid export membrane protein
VRDEGLHQVTDRPGDAWRRTTAGLRSTLSSQVARQGYLSAFEQGVISLTNFSAALILARAISPTEFGVYAVGFLLLHLGRAVQEGVIIQPLAAIGAALPEDDFRVFVSGAGAIQLVLAGAASAGAAVVGLAATAAGNTTAGPMVSALWFPLLSWQGQEFLRRVFYTRKSVPAALTNTVVASMARLASLGILLASGQETGRLGLAAIGWGAAAGCAVGLVQTRRLWSARRARPVEVWNRSWGYARWVLGGTISNWVAVEVYPILTAGMISFAAAGAYRALQNVVAPVHALLRAMDTYFTPRLAERFHRSGLDGARHMLRRMYGLSGAPILGYLAVSVVLSRPVLAAFYGNTYLAFAPGLGWMAVFYALWFAYWPLQSALKAIQWTRPFFLANLLAAGAMFTLGVWAIARWGVYGTIAGQALNALIVAVTLWWAWFRSSRRIPLTAEGESARPAGPPPAG